jgi:hypothetical protein
VSAGLVCGCCEGISAQTPVLPNNRPGLAAVAYRVGTWAQFKASMLDALSTAPQLAALRTRGDDDFTIALLDAWAIVCDILTFYEERIANESYLRTATERVSVGELAKLVGYRLRPGTAASAALAFTIDVPLALPPGPSNPPTGTPVRIALDTGTKVQSVPDPGQQPATFETIAPIVARAAWNAIRPRLHVPPRGDAANASANVRLAGLVAPQAGSEVLLIARSAPWAPVVQRVATTEPDTATQTTLVRFEADAAQTPAGPPPAAPAPPPDGALDETFLWNYVKGVAWADQTQLVAYARSRNWDLDRLEEAIDALRGALRPGAEPPLRAFALGTRAALFGHNAPLYDALPASMRIDSSVANVGGDGTPTGTYTRVAAPFPASWEGATLSSSTIDLDAVYPAVVAGSRLVLRAPGVAPLVATVGSSRELTRTGYLLTAKVTEAVLDAPDASLASFPIRTTQVLGTTDELTLADVVVDDAVDGNGALTLDGAYLSLAVGQLVALTGVRADERGETASEIVAIASLALTDGYTAVTFAPALSGVYVRASVTLDANVAPATHGESQSEVLGSGDATVPFQRFPLKQSPLTYVSARTPSGNASTLVVRVNGVRWDEVPWLYGRGARDRVYALVAGADGKTYVQFGDGVTGARPPSGTNNVLATYRRGIGSAGNVRAGQLSMLLSRPLGLKAVTNPLPSSGAGDPDTLDQARTNAPIAIRTLDRIVTLDDFADFARAFAGIAKALVTWLPSGARDAACVTVAGIGGALVTPGTPQYDDLLAAMIGAGDGTVPVVLCDYVPVTFTLAATVTIDPALVPAAVLAAVEAALRAAFSFDARGFAQPVFRSEVIATVQDVPGVIAMTLDAFGYSGAVPSAQPEALLAAAPALGANGPIGAQLLTLDAAPLRLTAASA